MSRSPRHAVRHRPALAARPASGARLAGRAATVMVVCIAVVALTGVAGYALGLHSAAQELRTDASRRLDSYGSALGSELQRY